MAKEDDIDLSTAYGFGNEKIDIDFLQLLGNPVAVNTDKELESHAKKTAEKLLNSHTKTMDIFEVIKNRRSIRAYKPNAIEDDKLARVLESARLAPSAANKQPFKIIVIKSDAVKKKLISAYPKKWFWEAPIIICSCTIPENAWKREDGKCYADVDLSIAMDHLVLSATNEGLGTCWVAAFKTQIIKDILLTEIDKRLEPVALTPLGYPDETPSARNRKPYDEMFKII